MALACLAAQPLLNQIFLQWHHTNSAAAGYESLSIPSPEQKWGGKLLTPLGLWTFLLPVPAVGSSAALVSRVLHSPAASHCFYTGHMQGGKLGTQLVFGWGFWGLLNETLVVLFHIFLMCFSTILISKGIAQQTFILASLWGSLCLNFDNSPVLLR